MRGARSDTPEERPAKIRWAPRLAPRLLERLYDAHARGLEDTELCDEVGFRLHERCRTFVLVSRGEVECPRCGTVFSVSREGATRCPREGCTWSTTVRAWRESLRNHYAHTGRAVDAFSDYHRRYPAAKSYREKILLIDQLIHSFHVEESTRTPVKSVASKLLEGNKTEVVRFLDRLSSADPDGKSRWRRALAGTIHAHVTSREPGEDA